jgi:predicted transcriptional regulator
VKNRTRLDILVIILEFANGGITKTKLLARINLTSEQLGQHLDIILTKKLMVQLADADRRQMAYRITKKGIRYLSIYSTLKSIAVFQQDEH